MFPCCPRPDKHGSSHCALQLRLTNPGLCFDDLEPEEQFFLFEAPYLPRFQGSFPALSAWFDPAINARGYAFARLDRDPRIKCTVPQWRQDGSLYVASTGFATGYFSDRNGKRWRLVEFLAPGSFLETKHEDDSSSADNAPLPLPLPLDSNVDDVLATGNSKRSRRDDGCVRKKKKRTSRRKGKDPYACVLQLRSDTDQRLPLALPAPVISPEDSPVRSPVPSPTPAYTLTRIESIEYD